ncbi:MAG: hypothetical protein JSW37_08530, partial [Anaerolineales bacterium]
MTIIKYKRFPHADADTDWDGAAERKAAEISDLKVMCCWYDGDDPDSKGSYKLPHHRASDHYTVLKGVKSALKLLNATHLPQADVSAVRSHLERHEAEFEGSAHPRQERGAAQQVTLQAELVALPVERRYEVIAITAGQGNGLEYSGGVLQAAAPLFDGATVFVDHPGMDEWFSMTGNRSLRNVLGVLSAAAYKGDLQAITGILEVYPGPDAEWFCALADRYLADRAAGKETPRVGLSAVLDVTSKGREVHHIERVISVDAVFDPARGGEVIRALNQQRRAPVDGDKEGAMMEVPAEYVTNPPSEAGGSDNVTEGSPTAVVQQQVLWPPDERVNVTPPPGAGRSAAAGRAEVAPQVAGRFAEAAEPETPVVAGTAPAAVALSGLVLDARLAQTRMPEAMQEMLRHKYGGCVFDLAALDSEIEMLQAAWAASVAEAAAPVRNVGAPRWEVGLNEQDKLQAVMDQLCGLPPRSELLAGVRPVSGIRELYLMLSGDYDFQGVYRADRVALANVTTSTMTSLVKNAFNKVILDWFNSVDLWWRPIVSEEQFNSMKDLTLITLGGFGDLPTVAEGAAYTELSWS